eukprot:gene1096-1431_t
MVAAAAPPVAMQGLVLLLAFLDTREVATHLLAMQEAGARLWENVFLLSV